MRVYAFLLYSNVLIINLSIRGQGTEDSAGNKLKWLSLPFTRVDGLASEGQLWVRQGLLAATGLVPANAGIAVEMLVTAFQSGKQFASAR